mmetsp:Transcript_18357/g.39735  ORF Transcript_18357/g.39735 Transcript_18357/m.39735 type:complete len:526 (+) Transcript_18357:49-1626(+)
MTSSFSSTSGPFVRCLLPRPLSSSSTGTSRSPSHTDKNESSKSLSANQQQRSRLVLLQHTHNLSTRLTASCPADANASASSSSSSRGTRNKSRGLVGGRSVRRGVKQSSGGGDGDGDNDVTTEDELYRLAGLRTPSESCTRDLSGGLLTLCALEQIVVRTGGRVVWVKICDNLTLPESDTGTTTGEGGGWVGQFRRHGATVDLASDPLGWDEDCSSSDGTVKEREEEKASDVDNVTAATSTAHRSFKSRMDGLQMVLDTIERAASSIVLAGCDSTSDDGTSAAIPVPVVFDSITPLINLHGMVQTTKLLRHLLGRVGVSAGTVSTTHTLSPVVVPLLIESTRPHDMRCLEDAADAIITLSDGEMRTARRGGGDGRVGGAAGRLINDIQKFALQQQQNNGSNSQHEKLILLKSQDQEASRRTVKSKASNSNNEESSAATTMQGLSEQLAAVDTSTSHKNTTAQLARPKLQIGEDGRGAAAARADGVSLKAPQSNTSRPGPRIFVQDDDPEYDDMDEEEDLDDDLDI